jgi:hypothetical protein
VVDELWYVPSKHVISAEHSGHKAKVKRQAAAATFSCGVVVEIRPVTVDMKKG